MHKTVIVQSPLDVLVRHEAAGEHLQQVEDSPEGVTEDTDDDDDAENFRRDHVSLLPFIQIREGLHSFLDDFVDFKVEKKQHCDW